MISRRAFVASLLAAGSVRSLGAAAGVPTVWPIEYLRHDLDFLWNTMLEIGPFPFASSNRRTVTDSYHKVRAGLRPMDAQTFFTTISPVFGALNDIRVSLELDPASMANLAFPMVCRLDGSKTIVIAAISGAVASGSTLVSINGIPAERIRDATLSGCGGQTSAAHAATYDAAYAVVASLMTDNQAGFEVHSVSPDGANHTTILPHGKVILPTVKIDGPMWTASDQPYEYYPCTATFGSFALIDYRRSIDRPAFSTFLARVFGLIRDANTRAIIVDLRHNDGGEAELNLDLWAYLTDRPISQVASIVERSSPTLKRSFGQAGYVDNYGLEAWNAPDGVLVTLPEKTMRQQPNPLRFKGQIIFLIGPGTFSSAVMCAMTAKAYGLATIIGEETAQPAQANGGAIPVHAHYTGTVGHFPTKYFTSLKGLPPNRGIIPDIIVKTTIDDIIKGRDPVLDRAFKEIHDVSFA